MSQPFRVFVSFILFSILTYPVAAQDSPLTSEAAAIEQLVLTQMSSFDSPGIAVGVIKNGQVLYAGAHGVQDIDSKKPMTTKSLFHMASVSKPFVATAMVQLLEQGKVRLEDKLTDHLPYFTMADERYRDITLGQMLGHSSGIPDVEDYEWDTPEYDDGAAERYARSFDTVALDFEPGKRFRYSNAAFDILCDVIAKAAGMTFESYVKKYIFEPVGMVNSTFMKPEVPEDLATQPHLIGADLSRIVSDIYPYNRKHAGSSTLHSNVEDMLLWAQVNLNKGIINGTRIYKKSSYDLLTSTQNRVSKRMSVGLSWFLGEMEGSKFISHSGGDLGYSTFFGFLPEEQSAIVMMVNIDDFWSQSASSHVLTNAIFDNAAPWKAPIHYKLKSHILTDGIDKTKEVYYNELERSPQRYLFRGGFIDQLGYWLMDRNQPQSALDVFLFNLELEPNHAGWNDSVGDAYVAMDNTDLAIEWFRKALKINPNRRDTQNKLNRLLGR